MFLYNVFLTLYRVVIHIASLFNKKLHLFLKGRKNTIEQLREFKSRERRKVYWFHAASLGEFEQGLPLMEAIKDQLSDIAIVVSFFSPSGYELRKDHPIADHTCYLPLDSKSNARLFVETLDPYVAFNIKYEFWYYMLREVKKRNIPLYGISMRFIKNSIFFKSYGSLHRRMLGFFDHIFVQNQNSLELLESIGVDSVSVSGDTRFERVKKTVMTPNHYDDIAHFSADKTTIVLGSVWPEDMEVLNAFINEHPELKFIIAPHVIDQQAVQKITHGLTLPFELYTDENRSVDHPILVLDTIGMLSSIYQYGDIAYIGGAFGDGLHNILEAVAFGLPVVFGAGDLRKYPEAMELIDLKGAFAVKDSHECKNKLEELLEPEARQAASQICLNYIEEKAGATAKIMKHLGKENLW